MTISGILLREMSCVFSFIQDIRIDSINIIGGITDIIEIRDLLYFDYFKKLNIHEGCNIRAGGMWITAQKEQGKSEQRHRAG